jgi:LysM repeat protein
MKRIIIFVVFGALLSQAIPLSGQTSYPDPAVIQDIFNRVNTLRERRGLPPYSTNAALTVAAQGQAQWLVETGRRTHVRPDGSRPSTRAMAAGYITQDWCCGENYYMSIDATPDMVWNFWVWSPSHYVNLVHPRFDEVGIGMFSNGIRHSYVMVFGNAPDPSAPLPTAAPVNGSAGQSEYIVQRGDTLLSISRRVGVGIDALAAANSLVNPSLIYPGQRLVIPGGAVNPSPPQSTPVPAPTAASATSAPPLAPPAAGQQTHIVQAGENLFRIALRYGVTMQAIMAANGMSNPTLIYAGQQLVIPEGGTSVTGASQTTTGGTCSGFQATSPVDGYRNGATPFYWNPASGEVTGYRVEIYNANGQLVASFEVTGSSTTLTGDMSTGHIGSGLTFSWQVVALVNGQAACTSQRITATRENSAP